MGSRKKSRTRRSRRRFLHRTGQRITRRKKIGIEIRQKLRRVAVDRWIVKLLKQRREARTCKTLERDPRIARAAYVNGVLIFETKMIHVEIDDQWYRIGRFEVEFDLQGHACKPITRCLESGKCDGGTPKYYYPCIPDKSWFCIGSRQDMLAELIKSGEDLAAAYLVLECFEHVNWGDRQEVAAASIPVPCPYEE